MSTHVFTFNRTHTATYVAENMRNLLRDIIAWSGLDPTKLIDDWDVLGTAVLTWLRSGHLYEIVMEFHMPGSSGVVGRWDFPITYDGSGVEDDMWVAREQVRRTIDKAGRPPAGARYTIILRAHAGRDDVAGMVSTTLRSTDGLVGRISGTAIATPDIMASLKYWRAA
jgi:hypothetical protein